MENNDLKTNDNSKRKRLMALAFFAFFMAGIIALFYVYLSRSYIYSEDGTVEAPAIALSSAMGGALERLSVKPGDKVSANQVIAQVGNSIIKTKDAGVIISTNNNIGKNFASNEAVAAMIKLEDLRLVVQVEEDKGFSEIVVGQKVFFTVDAFGSDKFSGIVDEVSPTAQSGDVVFNISNARQEQKFNVKIRYDASGNPQILNGMSAKVWIYKN
jgi:multidrug resistance efflux pump